MSEKIIIGLVCCVCIWLIVEAWKGCFFEREKVGESSSVKELESDKTKAYKHRLLEGCYENMVDKKTELLFHKHDFNWDYHNDRLDGSWRVSTSRFMVEVIGDARAIHDVESFEEFLNECTIEKATIFTSDSNISVLHEYRNPDDIRVIINGMKILEQNNAKKFKRR